MELVVAKVNLLKMLASTKARWDLTVEGIIPQTKDLELGTCREFGRDVTFQSVHAEVEVAESAQEAKLGGYTAMEAIVRKLEACQPGEVDNARCDGA